MSTVVLWILIFIVLGVLGYLEGNEERMDEDALIRQMIRESRKPKPRASRNPARFGQIGYQVSRRRRGLWRLLI